MSSHTILLVSATIFIFLGLTSISIAAVRHRGGARMLVWLGLFVGLFGIRILLFDSPLLAATRYILVIPGLLFWSELSVGLLKRLMQAAIVIASVIAIGGLIALFATGSTDALIPAQRIVAISTLVILAVVSMVPALARRYLLVQSPVVGLGMISAAAAVIYVTIQRQPPEFVLPAGFAVFVFSLMYVAARKMFSDERRLLAIQNELEIARGIQKSILPTRVPQIDRLRIEVAYEPMAAVGGDFYEFLPIDRSSVGILVADVTGHGVPAALIASMVKVAVQSAIGDVREPSRFLGSLNRILSPQLRGQLVSAAYLWLDDRTACYAAAGHPPLLWWRDRPRQVVRVVSNGLLFGVNDEARFPEKSLSLDTGDRFILYTDGLIEGENPQNEAFGLDRVEKLLGENKDASSEDLIRKLLLAADRWTGLRAGRQDDTTIIAVDVREAPAYQDASADAP